MRNAQRNLTIALASILVPVFMSTVFSGQNVDSRNEYLALVGATVYVSPTEEPVRNGVVLIQGARIAAVGRRASVKLPRGTQTLDCSGLAITAGFWNSHVHFSERKWADSAAIPAAELGSQLQDMFTRYGFTSVFDLSSPWENTRRLRDRIESGEVPGPRIRSTGLGLLPSNPGLPPDAILNFMGWMKAPSPEVADAEQAAAASRKLLEEGVDGIKLFASAPSRSSLPESAIRATANEAHRLGKPVFVHPNSGADVLAAIGGGADVIAHTTPQSGPWDEAILAAMKERRVALIPTLTIWKYYMRHDRISAQDQVANTEIGQLRAWLAAGGTVLFGTDIGAIDYDPSEEYALMNEAGMSFRPILASLTTAPAERFGQSKQLGRIAAGLQADLVVLKDDPSRNLRALTAVQYTLRDGKVIYRAGK
ncbi:MAG TPA: amidohydrolase family protein [Terriglobia bacterium]|nr:amidohydrolase family protein [Terriglobia bacterium]